LTKVTTPWYIVVNAKEKRHTAHAQITNQGSDNQRSIDQGAAREAEKAGEG